MTSTKPEDNDSGISPMLGLVAQLPTQLAQSYAATRAPLTPGIMAARHVLVCGMGGSAAAGSLLAAVTRDDDVRVEVQRSYTMPGGLSSASLLLFSSYSGATEETLAAYSDALRRYPDLPRVVMGSGGALREKGIQNGDVILELPGGLPPRASLGHGVATIWQLLTSMDVVASGAAQLQETVRLLEAGNAAMGEGAPENACRKLARRLYGKLPLLYGGDGLGEAAAWRLKAQINENSKALAYVGALPELNHNEIVGWGMATAVRENAFVVALRDAKEHVQVARRFEVTREVLGPSVHDWTDVESSGSSPLARTMSLVQFGDYLSTYLAGEYGVDPMGVVAIDRLKARLAESG